MEFHIGERYQRPGVSASSWYAEALGEIRQERVSPVPVEIEILGGGGTVRGNLDHIDPGSSTDVHGVIVLEGDGYIPCEDIEAFTLLPDPPPDVSDELRS